MVMRGAVVAHDHDGELCYDPNCSLTYTTPEPGDLRVWDGQTWQPAGRMTPSPRRVRGHRRYPETRPYVAGQPSADTTGMIICQCGEYSVNLPDAIARERWYRQHLDTVAGR
jgi:hypothetical protein